VSTILVILGFVVGGFITVCYTSCCTQDDDEFLAYRDKEPAHQKMEDQREINERQYYQMYYRGMDLDLDDGSNTTTLPLTQSQFDEPDQTTSFQPLSHCQRVEIECNQPDYNLSLNSGDSGIGIKQL